MIFERIFLKTQNLKKPLTGQSVLSINEIKNRLSTKKTQILNLKPNSKLFTFFSIFSIQYIIHYSIFRLTYSLLLTIIIYIYIVF